MLKKIRNNKTISINKRGIALRAILGARVGWSCGTGSGTPRNLAGGRRTDEANPATAATTIDPSKSNRLDDLISCYHIGLWSTLPCSTHMSVALILYPPAFSWCYVMYTAPHKEKSATSSSNYFPSPYYLLFIIGEKLDNSGGCIY